MEEQIVTNTDPPLNSSTESDIHPFNNTTNVTVIEKQKQLLDSDSGVEVTDFTYQRALSSNSGNSQELDQYVQSCDSSISLCSNYDEAYNLLVRRNSTLLEGYTLKQQENTSENGSESSSIVGSNKTNKKKVALSDKKLTAKVKPPVIPKTAPIRLKSIERVQGRSKKSTPTLDLKKETKKRTNSSTRTPVVTPTDDGRWPSINSKPAPLMSRSLRLETPKITKSDTKTIEKYATLPRRKKEKSCEDLKKTKEGNMNRLSIPKKFPTTKLFKKKKIKIYHETSNQTVLTMSDVDKALAGMQISAVNPMDVEKCDKDLQVDMRLKDLEQVQLQLKQMTEKHESLTEEHKKQSEKLKETESKLKEEQVEKEGLKEELKMNSQRVLAILGENNEEKGSDSLLVLESRFQNVSLIVIKQEEEISNLNSYCRSLQIDLEKSMTAQRVLVQQQQDLEAESVELQEFMQAEKTTLSDALKEAELEINKLRKVVERQEKDAKTTGEEVWKLQKLNDQRWQENLTLQAKLGALEAKSRELLVQQGSSVSGTSVALSALIGRLESLVYKLAESHGICDQSLEDDVFHNEAYSNSSSSPDHSPKFETKLPDSNKMSTFVSVVVNAIRNAAAQTPFAGIKEMSRDNLRMDHSSSTEMLDLETEPCLMMEHVLEDVIIPDGHSHNMISSSHSLISHSDLKKSQSLTNSLTSDQSICCDIFPSFTLVDQVIDVDNLVTRLLKVIRILQLDNEDFIKELQVDKDKLEDQMNQQKETNKIVVKQLKDWEILGASLKTEVKELMQQLSKKNNEMDNIKQKLNNQREQVERLNQDVCELSTGLAKAERENNMKKTEILNIIKNWEKEGKYLSTALLGRLILAQNEIQEEKLEKKYVQMEEVIEDFSRKLEENLGVSKFKKVYSIVDKALEVFRNNQTVVQQCKPMEDLQTDLENISYAAFRNTFTDFNANTALLQAIAQIAASATASMQNL